MVPINIPFAMLTAPERQPLCRYEIKKSVIVVSADLSSSDPLCFIINVEI
jgi:hypothetical protein